MRYDNLTTLQLQDLIIKTRSEIREIERMGYRTKPADKIRIKELRADLRQQRAIMSTRITQPKLF